jgi:hypothetical protein
MASRIISSSRLLIHALDFPAMVAFAAVPDNEMCLLKSPALVYAQHGRCLRQTIDQYLLITAKQNQRSGLTVH